MFFFVHESRLASIREEGPVRQCHLECYLITRVFVNCTVCCAFLVYIYVVFKDLNQN